MLLHLIIAAALLAPGATSSAEATPSASIVCSLAAVELEATSLGGRSPALVSRPTSVLWRAAAYRPRLSQLTTQLRQ
jgi:hypothetical protein